MMKRKINMAPARMCLALCILLLGSLFMPGLSNGKVLASTQQSSHQVVSNLLSPRVRMISLSLDNVTFTHALRKLAKEANVGLSFNPEIIPDTKVTLNLAHVSVRQALDSLLDGTNLKAVLPTTRDVIVLKEKQVKQAVQAATVKGTVTDSQTGNTLPGVNILVKGTATGTATGMNGEYSLEVTSLQDTLVFSFIGYQTQEVPINGRTVINVEMVSKTLTGQELVVVGYGTQQKSDLTGSVGSVSSEELTRTPALNVEQALSGEIAGVNIATNSGRPGGRTEIHIRGYSSINASNEPLYVVDGVTLTSGISSINPNNIKSIQVLKDASATAIYGTRGSAGVVLITTKRGKPGESRVSYNGYVSVSKMARKQDVLSSEEFLMIEEQAYKNAEKFDPVGWAQGRYVDPLVKRQQYIGTLFDENLNPLYNVDWQDRVTRTAISHGHNLSYTGGTEKTTYGLFMGYTDANGIIKKSYMRKTNIRGVIDSQVEDWIKVGGSISYTRNHERRQDESVGGNNVTRMMIEMIPIVPYKYPDGTYGRREDYAGMESGDNPLAQIHEVNRQYQYNTFRGNTYVTIDPLPFLEFTSRFGVNVRNQHNPYFASTLTNFSGGLGINYAEIFSYESRFWQWSNHLNFDTSINEHHSIEGMIGAEFQEYDYLEWMSATEDMPDNYYKWNNLGAGSSPQAPSSGTSSWQMASYFARVNYNYDHKYLLTLTGRVDGSSRFGENNKYAFFPSGAVAWRISEEEFMENSSLISNLKLRVSYGLTGNSNIGEYQSMANLGTSSYILGGRRAIGSVINTLANPDLKWEKTSQLDVGVDIGLWNNRVEITADVFLKKTKDLLLAAPVPSTSGFGSMLRNIGSMENRGLELAINTVNIQSEDFFWNSSLNFTTIQNEITSLGVNDEDIFPGPTFLGEATILRVGESVGDFWGRVRVGTWDTDEKDLAAEYGKLPGDLRFKDLNNDKEINSEDKTIIGNGIADFFGSFTNTFGYKNFDLTVTLEYKYGNDVYKLTEHSSLDRTGIANSYSQVLNAWTPDNQDTPIAQWRPTSAGYDSYMDSHKVKDGSFIRGQNIVLGYTLPEETLAKIGINNLRLYLSAQNFFLITPYEGYDPEVSTYYDTFAQGIQFHSYPKARTFTFGINFTL